MTGVGSSPALAISETSQVLLTAVSGGFPGVLPFRPTYRLARLDMSEIVLKGTLNRIKKNKKKKTFMYDITDGRLEFVAFTDKGYNVGWF